MLPHSYPSFRLICLITSDQPLRIGEFHCRERHNKIVSKTNEKQKSFYLVHPIAPPKPKGLWLPEWILSNSRGFPFHCLLFVKGILCFLSGTEKDTKENSWPLLWPTEQRHWPVVYTKENSWLFRIVQSFWSLWIRSAENLHVVSTPIAQSRVCVSTDKKGCRLRF